MPPVGYGGLRSTGADACVAQHTQSHPLAIVFGLSGQQGCRSDQSQVFAGARSGEPGWPAAVAGLQVPRPAGAAEEHVKDRASTLAKSAWLEVEQIAAGRVAVVSRLLEAADRQPCRTQHRDRRAGRLAGAPS